MQRLEKTTLFYETLANSPRLRDFDRRFGTPARDIWEFLIATAGDEQLILMRGKFAEMGMEPRLARADAQRLNHAGLTILGDERAAVAFLNPTTAFAGALGPVERLAENRNEGAGVPASLQSLISQIPSENEIWFASVGPPPSLLPVAKVARAWGGIDPVKRSIDFHVEMETDLEAKTVADILGGKQNSNRVDLNGPIPPRVLDWLSNQSGQ